jgi:hypothetical protein
MALIFTPSLSLTNFCKSGNGGISKVTLYFDLMCQKLTLTLQSLMKILFTLIKFRNLYRVFKSFLSEISTAATVHCRFRENAALLRRAATISQSTMLSLYALNTQIAIF